MIISISGTPGSGKSTIAKRLAKKLHYKHYDMGGFNRQLAEERGITLLQLHKLSETDPEIDTIIDERQKKLGLTEDNFIIEGRISYHFIPQSLKICLIASPEEGARRILKGIKSKARQNEDSNLNSLADVIASNKKRRDSNKLRYKKYYNIDVDDPQNFDLIIDTTNLTIEQVLDQTYTFIKNRLAQNQTVNA